MGGIRILFLLFIAVSLVGCSKFRKIQKSGDWKLKNESALAYYEQGDYRRSNALLEDIIPIIRGTEEAELANFHLAYGFFHQKQYLLSANSFDEFARIYGRSEHAIEATYMHAYSLYLQSPDYQLDQSITYEAVTAMQKFINKYPSSEYASDADRIIDDMQRKLEKKAYNQCRLYYKLRRYKSALIVYTNFSKDFPDSNYNEEIQFLQIETSYDYAMRSIYAKQEDRFKKVIDFHIAFIEKYPSSQFLKDAERLYAHSIEKITIFAKSN